MLGEREDLGRAAAPAAPWPRGSRASTAPSSRAGRGGGGRRRRQVQPLAQRGRRGRAVVEDRPGHRSRAARRRGPPRNFTTPVCRYWSRADSSKATLTSTREPERRPRTRTDGAASPRLRGVPTRRRRGRRPRDAVRRQARRRRPVADRRARARSPRSSAPTAPARPPRSRPARATARRRRGTVRVLGLDPRRERARAAAPDRRDAAGRRRLERRPRRRDAAARRRAARAPAGLGAARGAARARRCGRTPYRRLSGGLSSSGSGWRWRWSGGPRWCSSTSRPPGMDPQARRDDLGAARGAARRRRDRGAHDALHGRGRAARRPGPHHRPGPAGRQRLAARADPRRRHVDDPAGRHPAVPARRPESLRAALGDDTVVMLLDELSLLVTGPADASTLAKVVAAGARRTTCCRSR